ncbi:IclR family transcriptional regulator [Streptomyces sp. NPDC056987]|uniref:IclR family transcriptional regulator n=1 Tax=Streptomyces sp. NPDC056987 TaxID=3345988 RepID=UPI00363E3BF2
MDRKTGTSSDETGSESRPAGLIGAVDNVLRLLRLFEDHEMIRVNQVARDMGLSRSTVHRMLATLSHHRFVVQDDFSRAYKPGPVLVDIGLSVVANMDIRTLAHGALTRLRDETDETVHLATLRGAEVLYVDSVESNQVVRTGSRTGWTLPAHATAAGKALLAELDDDELAARYPTENLQTPTSRAPRTRDELRKQLTDVRRLGYAVNNAESEADVSAVAAVVRDKRGRARAAVATTAPQSRVDDTWITSAAAATVRVARELGDRID